MAQARADSGSDKETSACKRIATDETFVSIRLLATVSKTIFLRRALDTFYIAGRDASLPDFCPKPYRFGGLLTARSPHNIQCRS